MSISAPFLSGPVFNHYPRYPNEKINGKVNFLFDFIKISSQILYYLIYDVNDSKFKTTNGTNHEIMPVN